MNMRLLAAALIGLLAGNGLAAEGMPIRLGFGVQGGLVLPSGDDLRMTAATGMDLGVHITWAVNDFNEIRPRLELISFAKGHQDVSAPLVQHLDTNVQGFAMGCEYLYRINGYSGRWATGGGLYLIRWSVDSTNRVSTVGGGVTQASSSSHWTREGLGLVGTYRMTPRLEAEARWISSHYGYQNLPARFATLGLLWRF